MEDRRKILRVAYCKVTVINYMSGFKSKLFSMRFLADRGKSPREI